MSSLLFIMGPTAVGKTELAFQIAQQTKSSIMNADSIQAYKDLNIGSSKPDFKKYSNVPCFLFDFISAPSLWTAGDFRRKSLQVLDEEMPKHAVLVVGGSGFYMQALEKGMYNLKPMPPHIPKEIEQLGNEKGLDFLYEELKKQDPVGTKNISSKDKYRIIRSLSIIKNEGKSLLQIQKEFKPQPLKWEYKKLGLSISKEELLERVEARTRQMIKQGLLDEIEALIQKGFEDWKPLQSVGYKEGLSHLKGSLSKEDLFSEIVKNTMALAKRQMTWLKRDKHIKWYSFKEDISKILKDFSGCFK